MNPTSFRWRGATHVRLIVTLVIGAMLLAGEVVTTQRARRVDGRQTTEIDGREVIEGEVIVRYRAGAGSIERQRAEFESDTDDVETIGRRGLRRMRSRRMNTRAMLRALQSNPDVELVEPNYVLTINQTPNDPSFGNLWGLFNNGQYLGGAGLAGADIDAMQAWDVTTGSRANVIGVIDTGIDYNHPDLVANIWTAPRAFTVTIGGVAVTCAAGTHGFNAITNTCNPMDDHSHGTHVAGTIGAVGNNGIGVTGVNWAASMMALKFLGSSGSGSTANAIKTIEFAIQAKAVLGADANVRILSNSWGGGGYSQALKNAIDAADSAEMLFVAAAGNDGSNNDTYPHYPSNYSSANVISVASTTNRDLRSSFSNWGANSVDLGAPGSAILSTVPGNSYASYNGTSMATPHVAGAAALVLAACNMTTANLKSTLLSRVDPVASMSGITTTGGRLNLNAAVRSCTPPSLTVNGGNGAVTVSGNSTITVDVTNGPGMIADWVTMVPVGSPDNHWSGTYRFMSGTTTRPSTGMTAATLTFPAPYEGGTFEFRMLLNGTYTRLATSAAVTVTAANPVPAITSLSTTSLTAGSPGFALTVHGTGFVSTSQARINGVNRATTYVSATVLTTALLAADLTTAGQRAITVANPTPGGGTSSSVTLTVTPLPTLTVNGSNTSVTVNGASAITVDVANGPGNVGDWVTLVPTGSPANHWSGNYRFLSGTTTKPSTGISNTTLTFPAPSAHGTYEFRLLLNSTYTRLATSPALTVAAINPAPAITSLSTASLVAGSPGFTLTITGTGFIPASQVRVNGVDRVTTYVSSTSITAAVLAGDLAAAGARAITVVNASPGGGTSNTGTLTVTVLPTLTVNGSTGPITVNGNATLTVDVANGPANISDWVTLVPEGSPANHWSGTYRFMSGTTARPTAGIANARLTFSAPAVSGSFEFRLLLNGTYTRLVSSPVVTVNAVSPTLTVNGSSGPITVTPNATITVNVANGPANISDWITMVPAGSPANHWSGSYQFLSGSTVRPPAGLAHATLTFVAPAEGGTFEFRLLLNSTYTRLATSPIVTVDPD